MRRLLAVVAALSLTGCATQTALRNCQKAARRGDYDRAIVELEAAVALLDADAALKALALTSLGRTYRLHGLPDRAIEIYERVLVLQRAAVDGRGVAQTRDAMAVATFSLDTR